MTLEQNNDEIEIELDLKNLKNETKNDLISNESKSLDTNDKDPETPPIDDLSPQEKKAAAKKAAQEKKAAAKKAAEEKKDAAKKAAEEKKDAAKKAAEEKKKIAVELPAYFTTKYPNYQDEKKAEQEAIRWFLGLDKDNKPVANSYSAKITYVGYRNSISKQIKLAKRAINLKSNNWKMFLGTVHFFKNQEVVTLIKDPAFIKEALSSDNYKVRIILDSKIKKQELKSQHFAKDDERILKMKPRLRCSMIAAGLQPPLHKGEAKQFLQELDANQDVRKDLYTEAQRKWLEKKIKEDETEK